MEKKVSVHLTRQYLKAHIQSSEKGFVPAIFSFVRGRLGTIFLVLGLLLFGAGIFWSWRYYQYRQSGMFAFVRFSESLQPPDAEKLAKLIDFNKLSERLARAIAFNYAFFKQGPNQTRDLKDMIQKQLLQKVVSKEEPAKAQLDSKQLLQKPLVVLPDDFLLQLTKNLTMHAPSEQSTGDSLLLSSSVEHPMLDMVFPVILRMDNSGGEWKIRDIANSDDLVKQFRQAQLKRMVARRDELLQKRTEIAKRMDGIISLQTCTAGVEKLSDGRTFLLMANILGRNIGSLTVNNTNLEVVFNSRGGEEIFKGNLNVAQAVRPGEDYNQHWSIDFDQNDSLGQLVLKAEGIVCGANWHSMGLSNGEVLYLPDYPEMMEDFR